MTACALKLIAAFTMFLDHMGLILFPHVPLLRVIGRLAFPLYAYCIAEGFRYTKNRRRYFCRIFLLGLFCQIVYTFVERELYLGVLLTFSLSLLLLWAQDGWLTLLRGGEVPFFNRFFPSDRRAKTGLAAAVFFLSLAAVFLFTQWIPVDYGFFGVLLPVCAGFFPDRERRLLSFGLGLTALSLFFALAGSPVQLFSLFAMVPLLLYNGKPGKYKLKTFFYLFYPAHLALLYAIDLFF